MVVIQVYCGFDGFGVEVFDQVGVGFCYVCFLIIDLNELWVWQFFFIDDGEVLMVYNGEFYDFQCIRVDFIV